MGAYFQAEKLKNRHTFLWGLTILMPLVCSLLSAQLTHRYFAMDGYNWWYMMMMPGFLTIICGLVGGKDLKKQNRTIGSLPADTGKILGCQGTFVRSGKRHGNFCSYSICVLWNPASERWSSHGFY